MANPLNGLSVDRRAAKDGNTLFVPLPRALWTVSLDGKCRCAHCAAEPGRVSYWDTLAISFATRTDEADTTWVVHRPEHNPERFGAGETTVE